MTTLWDAMFQDVDAVIFDLDGTLVDSMWMWEDIDIEFLGGYGYEIPADLQKKIEGMSYTETAKYFISRFSLPLTVPQIQEIWNRMAVEKYRSQVPLKPGVRPFLEHLKLTGIPMAIATSNGRELVDTVLEALDIGRYFKAVTTGCEVERGKPAPDIYLESARRLGVLADRCLVFEDVPAGILAGKRAGMRVCAVEDAFSREMREEKQRLADYYIENFAELDPALIDCDGRKACPPATAHNS